MTDEQIIRQWEEVLATGDAPIGVYWSVFLTTQMAKETFDMLNRQRETIGNQDEMIRALINAQETLQKAMAEKDAEIEKYEKTVGKLFINDDGTAFATLNGNKTEYITKKEANIFKNMAVNNAEKEAIKEFAERLKKVYSYHPMLTPSDFKVVAVRDIDNLVKEKVGDTK